MAEAANDLYEELLQAIITQEGNTQHGRRAQLDVKLAKDFSHRVENLGRSIDVFNQSMDESCRRMFWLTGALVFVGLVQVVAIIVEILQG